MCGEKDEWKYKLPINPKKINKNPDIRQLRVCPKFLAYSVTAKRLADCHSERSEPVPSGES
jgi:hypothetical protein